MANKGGLSTRGWDNVGHIMPKISAAVKERERNDNPNIDLATAENWLIRPELIEMCKTSILENLVPLDFSYPRGFGGFPSVLEAFANLFNSNFNPKIPVEVCHLATAPGAASCVDALLYNICEAGDDGFDFIVGARTSVVPVPVVTESIDTALSINLIAALEDALKGAKQPIKAVILTNPSNPISKCYPKSCIEECIKFCHRNGLHYISDEVYALTEFVAHDMPNPEQFVSALSIDIAAIGCDPSRVHTIWSTSKDLGSSGIRMGCTVTQANPEMQAGLVLASNTTTSSLSAVFVSALLTSPKLPEIFKLSGSRLSEGYSSLTSVLKKHDIPYIPANKGLYLFAKIVPECSSWEEEATAVSKFQKAGVNISGGRSFHGPESGKGWARIGFAVEKSQMDEAIKRIDLALSMRVS